MRLPRTAMLLIGCLAAAQAWAQLQPLSCPPPPAGRPCEAFHFHVQMYRPDTKAFTEIYAGPQFATEAACERARSQQIAANAKVVDFFRSQKDAQYPADRVGPCHCDMTSEKSSFTYLGETQRAMQLRTAGEIRLRVRERLLDRKVPTESETMRALYVETPATPALATARVVSLPGGATEPVAVSSEDLRPTRTLDLSRPAAAALDLPLVDVQGAVAPAGMTPASTATTTAATTAVTAPAAPAPAAEPVVEETVEPTPSVVETAADAETPAPEEETTSTETAAERFISYETQRIQNVLRASAAIADENVKTKIFEACMERIQLLSNLRLLIEGSGVKSRLAVAARDAFGESARLALVSQLFGDDVKPHWAPKDAADVVFEVEPAVASAPERVLRDTTGRFSTEQKKHALYLVLAQTQPTEEQRLWLSTVVEEFLK